MLPFSVLMLAHDLDDSAIARRATMLRKGGAEVLLAGFRRRDEKEETIANCPVLHLAKTKNAAFLHRIITVMGQSLLLSRHKKFFETTDVLWARNLEMLALAVRSRSFCRPGAIIVYECLDIHRLLARHDIVGWFLRKIEGWLARRASLLVTSSPAFIENYFKPLSDVTLPILLLENKVFPEPVTTNPSQQPLKAGPPWKIGWFGIIRCRKSLEILKELVEKSNGTIEVIIRGRPAPDLFGEFDTFFSGLKNIKFQGPYRNPEDIEKIYREVHFIWAIDFFEEGLNSDWLLPNRLYESGAFGVVPLALQKVETGAYLKRKNLGAVLEDPLPQSLLSFFKELTPEQYEEMKSRMNREPQASWVSTTEECHQLVAFLKERKDAQHV